MYIYIHIPFCSSICSYCDFPKLLYDKKYIRKYLEALQQEIKKRYQGEEVDTIYIGGGTPTSLDLEELRILMDITNAFVKKEEIEFTIESNVESLTLEKIRLLKQCGVNRISLGVQSFQNDILKELNRHHTKEDVYRVVKSLKREGFSNISIDYIYGVHSSLEEIQKDMDCFLTLDIPHVSCYSLIIEEGTVFGIQNRTYIEEEKEEHMYRYIEKRLEDVGYVHYEISNYAKEGFQSLHNLNYWNNGDYYGFGMGAVSFLENHRISNTKSLTKYLEQEYQLVDEYEDKMIRISNAFMLGLRMIKGISVDDFKRKYHRDIMSIHSVKELIEEGKLILEDKHLFIAPEYFYLSNEIILNFMDISIVS